jgi:hypothetical protein
MTGSEAQLRRAGEIRDNVLRTMDGIVSLLQSVPGFDPQNPAHTGNIDACAKRIQAVQDCEQASDLIDCFGSVRFTGDVYSDFGALQAVYSTATPATEGQRKLLLRY